VYIGSNSALGLANFANTGQQAVVLDYGGTTDILSQTLATTGGQSYAITFYVSDDTGGNDLMASFGSITLFDGTTAQTGIGSYNLFSYTATAASSSTILSFSGLFTDTVGIGTILDDVSVVPVPGGGMSTAPEPGVGVLLAGGLAILGAFRSIRRRAQR
jgi:hypothetical protein